MSFSGFARNANTITSKKLALLVCESSKFDKPVLDVIEINTDWDSSGSAFKSTSNAQDYLFVGYTEQDSLQSTLEVGDAFSASGGPKKVENYNINLEATGLGTLSIVELKFLAENTLTILAVDANELEGLDGYSNGSVSLVNLGDSSLPGSANLKAHWIIEKVGFVGGYNVADGKADRVPLKFEREKISSYTNGIYQDVGCKVYVINAKP